MNTETVRSGFWAVFFFVERANDADGLGKRSASMSEIVLNQGISFYDAKEMRYVLASLLSLFIPK